jgi:signal transduction histidine kinase
LEVHRSERTGRLYFLCIARDLAESQVATAELPAYFAVAFSHELRTPLTTILGSAEVLLRAWARLDDAAHRTGVERLLSGARRLDLLVRDLLLVVGLEEGDLLVRPACLSLAPLLEQALYDASVAHPNLDVRARGLRDAPTVWADPDRVVQVLVHLLDNAARHGQGAGPPEVRVETMAAAGTVRIRVSDRGPGLPAEGRERLFTRFSKLSPASHGGRFGIGLGLYICRQLVEVMGGAIGVESKPGKGASFWFTLPLAGEGHGPLAGEGHGPLAGEGHGPLAGEGHGDGR